MLRKSLLGSAICAGALLAGATVGHAGEITGNGKSLKPLNANSICAFSGLNDDPDDPEEGGKVQNWGSIPKEFRDFLASIGESPGVACNGHLNPYSAGDGH